MIDVGVGGSMRCLCVRGVVGVLAACVVVVVVVVMNWCKEFLSGFIYQFPYAIMC